LLNRKKERRFLLGAPGHFAHPRGGGQLTHFVAVTEDITQARQAADALEKEAARRRELERIITISPAVAFLWRAAPGWPVEYVSDNVRRWGYTPEDLMRAGAFSSLIHGEDHGAGEAEVETFTREGRHEFVQEYRLLDRSGGVHWVEDRTWLRRDAGGYADPLPGGGD
jgi:sigma-B regulation protein RsbU (phosphoserine phosphatase)